MISGYAKGISWRRCSRRGIRRSIHIGGRAPLGRPAEMRAAESAEMRAAESAEGAGADTVGAATAGFGGAICAFIALWIVLAPIGLLPTVGGAHSVHFESDSLFGRHALRQKVAAGPTSGVVSTPRRSVPPARLAS